MPRRRPISQATSEHVVATPKKATAKKSEVIDETAVPVVQSEIEDSNETLVADTPTPEPEVPVDAPVEASRTVSTPAGPVETKEAPQPSYRPEGAPNGLILKQGDPVRLEGEDAGIAVIVKRDVYREVYPSNSRRPSYVLVYPRGARVLKSTLQRLP